MERVDVLGAGASTGLSRDGRASWRPGKHRVTLTGGLCTRLPVRRPPKVGEIFGERPASRLRRLYPGTGLGVQELLGDYEIIGVLELSKMGGQVAAA